MRLLRQGGVILTLNEVKGKNLASLRAESAKNLGPSPFVITQGQGDRHEAKASHYVFRPDKSGNYKTLPLRIRGI